MKVLIVKVSALGDVVHALPVLPYLKSVDSSMEIDWLVEESFAPLLDGHPLIKRVHRLRTKAWRKSGSVAAVRGAWRLAGELRRERYDVVLDLQGNSKSGLFTLLAGAPRRFGFDGAGAREWPNRLATNRKVSLTEADYHITTRSLAVARAAFPGGEVSCPAGPLPVDPQARAAVAEGLREFAAEDAPIVVLHYGTTWSTKLWPLERWCELAAALGAEHGTRLVLTWGSDDELVAAKTIAEAGQGRTLIWPRGPLPELVALLARADLVSAGIPARCTSPRRSAPQPSPSSA